MATRPDWLRPLLRDGHRSGGEDFHAGRFEGVYGGLYDRVIQSDALRRFAPLFYGDAGPVVDLDGFAARVAAAVPEGGALLDVPSGGGTLLPRLAKGGLRGRVIECDLGSAMLARAERMSERVEGLDVALLQADAQDLPLRNASVSAAVSLNGLHCIPDPHAFAGELGRVVEPGGRLWLVTLVSGATRRADAVIAGGRLTGVLPGPPPRRGELEEMIAAAGFADLEPLGGSGLAGIAATRR